MELRFVTRVDWTLLPGLLFPLIKERYPDQRKLAVASLPEEALQQIPDLAYASRMQFSGQQFVLNFGPKMVSLAFRGEYPGWQRIKTELEWLSGQIRKADFIQEGDRLGMRYIDFFEGDIFEHLVLDVQSGGEKVKGVAMNFATVFQRGEMTARLILNNAATVPRGAEMRSGSILDLDVWMGASSFDVSGDLMAKFEAAHQFNKEIFFGLLKTEFLDSLAPQYE